MVGLTYPMNWDILVEADAVKGIKGCNLTESVLTENPGCLRGPDETLASCWVYVFDSR